MTPVHRNSRSWVKILLGLACIAVTVIWPYWRAQLRGDYNYVCGDSIVDPYVGETCDPPGSAVGPSGNACREDCTFCGDGSLDVAEDCDDANGISGDGCENDCTLTCAVEPAATLEFKPKTLNKKSQGLFMKATIEILPPYSVNDVDPGQLIELSVAGSPPIFELERRIEGNQLRVKFSRPDIIALAPTGLGIEFEITGFTTFGCEFTAVDLLRVIDEGTLHTSEDDYSTILMDMIRGDVANLGVSRDGALGSVVCLFGYLSNATFGLNTDADIPAEGQAYFYLYEICGGAKRCSYGLTTAGNEREAATGECPDSRATDTWPVSPAN